MTIKPIKTERDYQKALNEIDKLWDAKPNTRPIGGATSHWLRSMRKSTTGSTLPIRSKPSSSAWNSSSLSRLIWWIFSGGGTECRKFLTKKETDSEMMRSLRKRLAIPAESLLA